MHYHGTEVARGTMAYKHEKLSDWDATKMLSKPQVRCTINLSTSTSRALQINFKLIPDVDWSPKVAQLIKYELRDIHVHGAWAGPVRLHLRPHINAPWADLPVVSSPMRGTHILADLTLPYGQVAYDYTATDEGRALLNEMNPTSMPLIAPSYTRGPVSLKSRTYMRIVYESDLEALRRQIPSEFDVAEGNRVILEWVRTQGSGFGEYAKTTQFVECINRATGELCNFYVQSYVDVSSAITSGREVFGQGQKYGSPALHVARDTLVGKCVYGENTEVAVGSMTYKYEKMPEQEAIASLNTPVVNVKLIPSESDGAPIIAQLTEIRHTDVTVRGAYRGPARLELIPHANCTLADLPIKKVLYGQTFEADMTLPAGRVIKDYLGH